MRVFIANNGHRYEAVPCGIKCSYAKKDGVDSLLKGFTASHCTKTCYCPKWWLKLNIDCQGYPTGAFFGLRKVKSYGRTKK